jgi:alternate signal-mediated exported protein
MATAGTEARPDQPECLDHTLQEHTMNKFAKGSLAAGAGLVLLLGGAGTLAYWNSEAKLQGGTINAGTLTLTALEIADPTDDPEVWVPGDSYTYKTVLTLETAGDNIQGTIEMNTEDIWGEGQAPSEEITVTLEPSADGQVKPDDASLEFLSETQTFAFDGAGDYTIPVEITVDFPFGEDVDNNSKLESLDLGELTFTATQTDPNA